tara:strand:- start:350 stop:487 length:138 start_codon:yes stop_codon:yes gene_type:complete
MMMEEKIRRNVKITILFLITLLGVSLASKEFVIVVLLFYIAFVKD